MTANIFFKDRVETLTWILFLYLKRGDSVLRSFWEAARVLVANNYEDRHPYFSPTLKRINDQRQRDGKAEQKPLKLLRTELRDRLKNWLFPPVKSEPSPQLRLTIEEKLVANARDIADLSRKIVGLTMVNISYEHDERLIGTIYDELGKSFHFEHLVQLLNRESEKRQ